MIEKIFSEALRNKALINRFWRMKCCDDFSE